MQALDSFRLAALVRRKGQPRARLFVCCEARLAEEALKAGGFA
jgi:hypothetical protein